MSMLVLRAVRSTFVTKASNQTTADASPGSTVSAAGSKVMEPGR
jgi:hypothetical protein